MPLPEISLWLCQIISVKRCWSVLNRFGQHYTTKSINASELRILKVIDFNVLLTHPLVYVETLLEIVGECSDVLQPLHIIVNRCKSRERNFSLNQDSEPSLPLPLHKSHANDCKAGI